MDSVVAKKYAKAIMEEFKGEKLEEILNALRNIDLAYNVEKFQEILKSPTVSTDNKVDLILGFVDLDNKKLNNLIKLIAHNKRLFIIPQIVDELERKLVAIRNEYIGKVYSNNVVSEEELKSLSNNFSRKFNSKINFQYQKSDIDGIKIEVEDLGIEVNFSLEKLKAKMSEYILQAI